MEVWPNFFIVGAPRTGTHSLYAYLKQHPQVFMSPRKEPQYFSRGSIPDDHPIIQPVRNDNDYFSLFKDVKNEIAIGEASVSYLSDPLAPKLIHEKVPNARIIIILRDPAERAYSHYLALVKKNRTSLTFYEEIKNDMKKLENGENENGILHLGFYYDSIKRYYCFFNKKNVQVLLSEEFEKNVKETVINVLKFLSIDKDFQFDITKQAIYRPPTRKKIKSILTNKIIVDTGKKLISSSKIRKIFFQKIVRPTKERPKMIQKERLLLRKIYFEDVNKTKQLLGKKLPWITFESI